MGLLCMNRFDGIPAAVICGLMILVRGRRSAIPLGLCYAATFALIVAPWVWYSQLRFDTWWISDNTRQVLVARDGYVMNYYATPPENDLLVRPAEWLQGLIVQKILMSWKGLVFTIIHSITLPLLAVLIVVRAGCSNPLIMPAMRQFLVCAGLLAASLVVAPTLVGYGNEWYFLPVQWFLLWAIIAKLYRLTPTAWTAARRLVLLVVLAIAIAPRESIPWLVTNRNNLAEMRWFPGHRQPTAGMTAVADAIERDSKGQPTRLLIYTHHPEGWAEWEYGALTGRPVAVMPRVKNGTFESYLRDYRITHIYDGEELGGLVDASRVTLVPLDLKGLYRVELRTQEK
jgi:hypothetical protein